MSTLSDVTVAVLGLGAMGLPMATNLVDHGAAVRGFDIAQPRLDLAAQAGVTGCGSAREAAAGADVVLLATEWDEYRDLDPNAFGEIVRERRIVDGRNVLDLGAWRDAGWEAIALGRP